MKLLSKFLIFSLIFAYGINKNFVLAAKKNHFSKIFLLWDNRTIALDFKVHPELIEKVPQYKVLIADNNLLLPQENLLSLPGVFPMETSFKNKISQENLRNFLESEINFEIKDQKPVEITIENEQVKFSRFPESGYFVSMENLVNLLDFALENEINYVHVPAKKIYSSIVSDSQLSEQGITEILSIGKSNFTGSSWQRKQNILAAVKKFNGQIIPAKGRFSFNKILESVNPADGFVPELVIKGNSVYAYVICHNQSEDEERLRKEINDLVTKNVGPIAKADKIQFVSGLPKTRSGKIMRRILRKIAAGESDNLGDTSTLLDPTVVEEIKNLAQ